MTEPIPPGTFGSPFPDVSGSMSDLDKPRPRARINIFDQDTLEHLRAQGVGDQTVKRVEAAMKDSAASYEENRYLVSQNNELLARVAELEEQLAEREPQVTWIIPLSYARELIDFLHRNMPGGYQAYHDELREAIQRAAD